MKRQIHKGIIVALISTTIVYSASLVLQAYCIVQIVNAIFIEQLTLPKTMPYFMYLLLAIIVRIVSNIVTDRLGITLAFKMKQQVRQMLTKKWQMRSLMQHFMKQTGEQSSLFLQTVDELTPYYREYIPQLVKSVLTPVLILIVAFIVHPNSGWIMLITAPFIPIAYIIVGIQTKQKAEQQLTAMNRFSGTFLDLLQGVQTIRIFRQQTQKAAQLQHANEQFLTKTMDVLKIAFASTLFIELITTLGIGLIALEIGFQMIVFEALAFAPAFFILILAPEYYNACKQLGSAFHTAKGSAGAMALLEEALQETEQAVVWGEEPLSQAPSLTLLEAAYTYENGPSIGPVCIYAKSKQTIALIGETGSGKTSILNLFAGAMTPQRGQYYIHSTEQQLISEQCFYEELVYLSQRAHIFAATLRDNLCMGLKRSDAQCMKALQEVSLSAWFSRLPNGLDTLIGEGGRGLSGGEMQRLAMARALLKRPSIVLFDEPTAHLDKTTEQAIHQAMETLSTNATTIIVSHRFATIQQADFIYVIENGRVAASGTPQMLQHPLYLRMKEEALC